MLSCKEAAALISESLDRKLPLGQRMALRLHLLMCRFCSRYRAQLLTLRAAIRRYMEEVELAGSAGPFFLSEESRRRIRQAVASQTILK